MGYIVQLKNDASGLKALYEAVIGYYKTHGDRPLSIFSDKAPGEGEKHYVQFLIDRRYVVKYVIVSDRGMLLSGLSLSIGPYFFGPADFWSYEDSKRFRLDASTEGIEQNLALLDEFIIGRGRGFKSETQHPRP